MSAAHPTSPSNDNNSLAAREYRRQANEYTHLARSTRSLRESSRYRKMAEACAALAREEDCLTGNSKSLASDPTP